nr:serine/threonine-protein kinase [uncultured Steroidobacter sp.]
MIHLLSDGEVVAGRYVIDGYVGEGGMQEVYLARDRAIGRAVALKIPKNNSATKRFQQSAAVSARVTHPNVAKTFDYVEDGDRQVLIEEFIQGQDLRARLLSSFLYLDCHLAAHVFHHLAKGLAAVHKEGVIHRDLKPSNIMLSSDYDLATIKITDFGIAKMAEAEIQDNVQDTTLASRTVFGAIPYMAPEVIRNKRNIGTAADVWSLGAILFHILTGELPFGEGLEAVERILASKTPEKPAILHVGAQFRQLTDDLWTLILACLRTDPNERPSALELVGACNSLCYSREPRTAGKIGTFKPKNGKWGFIECATFKEPTFFHEDSYWGSTPQVGQRVSFARFPGTPCHRAHPVLLLR